MLIDNVIVDCSENTEQLIKTSFIEQGINH
jgi:hypothetical protein